MAGRRRSLHAKAAVTGADVESEGRAARADADVGICRRLMEALNAPQDETVACHHFSKSADGRGVLNLEKLVPSCSW